MCNFTLKKKRILKVKSNTEFDVVILNAVPNMQTDNKSVKNSLFGRFYAVSLLLLFMQLVKEVEAEEEEEEENKILTNILIF